MSYFLKRIREPSTWAGIAAMGAVFGIPPEYVNLTGQIAMGVGGLVAILLPSGLNAK